MKKDRFNHILPYILWLLFVFIIGYFKIAHHELWKDEWQAWFVAKDLGIKELLSFLYYEGHPSLWYLYLKIFTIFSTSTNDVALITAAHLLTVAGGLYFLFVRFRLPILLKVLFAMSYFIFFEYGIVNRGYFLVILMVFWIVNLLKTENYSKSQVGLLLFLLCQTEVYGVLMAISLGSFLISKEKFEINTLKTREFLGFFLGVLIFVISVFPRTSGHVARTSNKALTFTDQVLSAVQGNLSNTYLIGSTNDTFTYGWTALGLILSFICLGGLWFLFRNFKTILLSGGMFLVSMLAFSIVLYLGGIRQWGMGFVFLIALLELRGIDLIKEKVETVILLVFCLFNIVHCSKAVLEEIKIPFTNAEKAGLFIRDKVPVKVPVVALNKFEATPVSGYAGRKFFELPDGTEFSYFKWVDKIYLPTEGELKLFAKFKQVGGIILLSPKPIDTLRFPSAQLWQTFDEINYKKENYYLYTLAAK